MRAVVALAVAVGMRRPATVGARNCCSKRGRRGGALGGSYECVMLSDTENNYRWAAELVGEQFCPLGHGTLNVKFTGNGARATTSARAANLTIATSTTPQRHPTNRNHGRPIRGSVAICDYDWRMLTPPLAAPCPANGARSSSHSAPSRSASSRRCKTEARGPGAALTSGIGSVASLTTCL